MFKRLFLIASIVLALSSFGADATAKPGDANGPPPSRPPAEAPGQSKPKSKPPVHAPEFDARTAGAAIALLAGGVAVLSARFRRRR